MDETFAELPFDILIKNLVTGSPCALSRNGALIFGAVLGRDEIELVLLDGAVGLIRKVKVNSFFMHLAVSNITRQSCGNLRQHVP